MTKPSKKEETKKFGQRVISIPKKDDKTINQKSEEPDTPIQRIADLDSPEKPASNQSQSKSQPNPPQEHRSNDIETIPVNEVILESDKYTCTTANNE